MQYLVMQTALPVDIDTGDWQTTTIGKKFSHTFGYGKIDTWATIEAAKSFTNVKPQAWYYSPWIHVKQPVPQGDEGLAVSYEVTADMLKDANLERLEHVTVTMNVEHSRRGDLSVELISPDGISSHLSATRRLDNSAEGYVDWTFMSVVHWGESGIGNWTVMVKDTEVNEHSGTFIDWRLKLWGECIDASKATLLPMPTDHDDDNHDEEAPTTTTIAGTTASITSTPTSTTEAQGNPTDHPNRPVNAKPSTTDTEGETAAPSESETSSAWLPSFFPTFGVSSKTQIWIYGSAALILTFCIGLAIYFYLARRKRLMNNPRDEWEFDLLEEDEALGLTSRGRKGTRGKGGKRRAGELYDAFAARSESESDDGRGYEDDEEEEDEGMGVGDEAEKRLYEIEDNDSEGGSGKHVIGDDDSEDEGDEKGKRPTEGLLR